MKKEISRKMLIVIIILLLIIVIAFGIIIFLGNNKTSNEDIKNSNSTIQGNMKNNLLSYTEIKDLITKEWNKSYGHNYKSSIDKMEKYEEDGKGRYIYIIYWHDVDRTVEDRGYLTGFELGYSGTDSSGEEYSVSAYVVNATEKPENAIVYSMLTPGKTPYELVKNIKNKEESDWGKDIK